MYIQIYTKGYIKQKINLCFLKTKSTPEPSCNGQPVTASHHLIGQSTSVCNSRRGQDPQANMIIGVCYSLRHRLYYSPAIKHGLCRPARHLVLLLDSELYTQISIKKRQARNLKIIAFPLSYY